MDMVAEFHRVFGRTPDPTTMVHTLEREKLQLRYDLVLEELNELAQAVASGDRGQILKEISDLEYVVQGFYLTLGINEDVKMRAFEEVHSSNMSKLMPDGSVKRREDGKVLKGPNYREADLSMVLSYLNRTVS